METKANYAIVGFFTLLVIAAAFGFVYWMAEYGRGGPVGQLAIRIPGSANGLSVGSPVRFNGIAVGTVRSLFIDRNDPHYSIAFTDVRADAPVTRSTKAILEIQGLTGAAYIELSGGSAQEENIVQKAHDTGEAAVLVAEQSNITNILSTADQILRKADDAIAQLQGFITDSRAPLTNTVRNAEVFSKSLADNAEGIDTFLQSVSALSGSITQVAGRLDTTLDAAEDILRSIDAQKIDQILSNSQRATGELANASARVATAIDTFNSTMETYRAFGQSAEKTLAKLDALVAAVDTQKVSGVMDNVAVASQDARAAIASFSRLSEKIAGRGDDIDQAIGDFTQLANKLNNASSRVDGILQKVDGLLGSGDVNSLTGEARATLASFRTLADNLNKSIGPISANLERFSGSGLRDIQSLINDTRGTMRNLNDAITNFDRDPQRLIFGGETVKEYDGRTRR